jgi:hypothetical protein
VDAYSKKLHCQRHCSAKDKFAGWKTPESTLSDIFFFWDCQVPGWSQPPGSSDPSA